MSADFSSALGSPMAAVMALCRSSSATPSASTSTRKRPTTRAITSEMACSKFRRAEVALPGLVSAGKTTLGSAAMATVSHLVLLAQNGDGAVGVLLPGRVEQAHREHAGHIG